MVEEEKGRGGKGCDHWFVSSKGGKRDQCRKVHVWPLGHTSVSKCLSGAVDVAGCVHALAHLMTMIVGHWPARQAKRTGTRTGCHQDVSCAHNPALAFSPEHALHFIPDHGHPVVTTHPVLAAQAAQRWGWGCRGPCSTARMAQGPAWTRAPCRCAWVYM